MNALGVDLPVSTARRCTFLRKDGDSGAVATPDHARYPAARKMPATSLFYAAPFSLSAAATSTRVPRA